MSESRWSDERLGAAYRARFGRPAPAALATETVAALRSGRPPRQAGSPWPRMVAGIAAVLAVALIGGGLALRFGVYPGGGSVTPGPPGFRTFTGSSITFDFPEGWELRDASTAFSGGSAIAVVGTLPIDPACGIGHVDINCYYERKLDPGTISVVIGTGAFRDGTIFDTASAAPPAVRTVVGGMPALFTDHGHVEGNYYDADLQLDWQIANPTTLSNVYTVSVGIRGPGVEEMRGQAEALVASLRLTDPPDPLPDDPAVAAAAGRAAIDEAEAGDRQMWAVGPEVASWYSCFGDEPGEFSFVRVETTPGGLLDPPLLVECTWSIEPEGTSFWRLDLVTRWPADDLVNVVSETRWLTADGTLVGSSLEGDLPPTTDATGPTASPTAPDPTPGTLAPELTGTAWRAVSIAGQPVSEPAVPRIEFDWLGRPNGWGFTGCDEFGFEVSFGGDRVGVGLPLLNPSGCNGPGAETKQVFLDVLQTADAWSLADDRLTLTGARGAVVFARDLPPPGDPGRSLAEALRLGTWRIVEAPGVDGLEHLSPLHFADRLLVGAGECGFSSDIHFGSGGGLSIVELGWDSIACARSPDGREELKPLLEAVTMGQLEPDGTVTLSGPLGDIVLAPPAPATDFQVTFPGLGTGPGVLVAINDNSGQITSARAARTDELDPERSLTPGKVRVTRAEPSGPVILEWIGPSCGTDLLTISPDGRSVDLMHVPLGDCDVIVSRAVALTAPVVFVDLDIPTIVD